MTPKGADLEATDLIEVSTIESGSYVTRSITGQELIDAIPPTTIEWGDIGGTLSAQTDLNTALNARVPTTRTLTINGTTQDLSANRTFTIPTDLTVGTTPISSGTIGRVLFQGTGNVLQQSGNLFWDNTNNRLGIGTETPANPLEISYNSVTSHGIHLNTNTAANSFNGIRFSANNTNPSTFALNNQSGEFRWGVGTGGYFPTIYSNGSERLRIPTTGNVLINTTTDAGFKLDVNGTARVQNDLSVSRNQNNPTKIAVSNTTAGNNSFVEGGYASDSSSGECKIGKYSSTTSAYKIITASNAYLYNGTIAGDIAILNDFATGRIKFATGGVSTAQMTLFSTGNLGINTTTDAGFKLDVNGTARVSGLITANGYRITTNGEGLTAANSSVGIVSYGGNGAASGYTFTLNNQYGGGNINRNLFAVGDGFFSVSALSSGTNTINWLGVYPVINNTGGTTTSRGIYYNPTLTNLTGTTHWAFHSTSGRIRFENLPTSATGLSAGDIWNDGGTLKIV
jgi:hypothetical protein